MLQLLPSDTLTRRTVGRWVAAVVGTAFGTGCVQRSRGPDELWIMFTNTDSTERELWAEFRNGDTGELLYEIDLVLDSHEEVSRDGAFEDTSGGVDVTTRVNGGPEQVHERTTGFDEIAVVIDDGETTVPIDYHEV